jgi:hypothetical protein
MSDGRGMSDALAGKLRGAVAKALAGDWQAAHLIVQEHEESDLANWIHAVCHRMEGDVANARYWYGRIRRDYPAQLTTEAELREIQERLGDPQRPKRLE